MKTIHKYTIDMAQVVENGGFQEFDSHKGALVLHTGVQREGLRSPNIPEVKFDPKYKEHPTIWAEVKTEEDKQKLKIYVFGTGHEIPSYPFLSHFGSVQIDGFVWHLYR